MTESGAKDSNTQSPGRRKLIAVLYADMVGYSRLIGLDDLGTLHRLRALRSKLIDPTIEEHGGKIVQTGGDSLLVTFDSIYGAVRCALQVQQQVPSYDSDRYSDRAILFRIAVNLGDAIADGTDLHGDAVNTAARLQAICPPGAICVSRAVRDHVHGRLNLEFTELGKVSLKNLPRPVEAFVVQVGAEVQDFGAQRVAILEPSIAAAPRLSLVVLPFVNLSGDPREDYLADVITEDLTADLSYLPGAVVIARHSAETYRSKSLDVRQIGEMLGVRYVVEGSVRKLADILRVNVQLTSTETNTHIWAGRFEQSLKDASTGQEEIVSRLREVLRVQIFDAESARSVRERPKNPDTEDLLLRGWALWTKGADPSNRAEATAFYEEALRQDPKSVQAMCYLADEMLNRFMIPEHPTRGDENLIERANALVLAATAIEPDHPRVISALANLRRAQGRWAEALAGFQRLIELYPNTHWAPRLLGFQKLAVGQADEAVALLQRSIRLDPLSPFNRNSLQRIGIGLLLLGHDEASIEWLQRALSNRGVAPASWQAQCYLFLASALAWIGRISDAHHALSEANRLWPFATVRSLPPTMTPRGLPHPEYLMQMRHVQEGLRLSGLRDHAEEDADWGIQSQNTLHSEIVGHTPTTVPGANIIRTKDLVSLIPERKPILIDVALDTWGSSIPEAIGLQGTGHGSEFTNTVQSRFDAKISGVTKGDRARPIVVFSVNSERFAGYNLALRLVALGYSQIYWYRGGVEAWEVNGLPESDLILQDW
jgi:adenylate cyclase